MSYADWTHNVDTESNLLSTRLAINLLEYPIPARPSQKASHGDISGTECGIIDPLVSKRPEKFWIRKFKTKYIFLKKKKIKTN